jgi:hypothetical protein
MGRLDSLAYDAASKRLFAAKPPRDDAPAGPLRVRFRFTSDPLVQLEGTYVDDVKITR